MVVVEWIYRILYLRINFIVYKTYFNKYDIAKFIKTLIFTFPLPSRQDNFLILCLVPDFDIRHLLLNLVFSFFDIHPPKGSARRRSSSTIFLHLQIRVFYQASMENQCFFFTESLQLKLLTSSSFYFLEMSIRSWVDFFQWLKSTGSSCRRPGFEF